MKEEARRCTGRKQHNHKAWPSQPQQQKKSKKMGKFLKSLWAFYQKIGIKYKSSYKECLKDPTDTIFEHDEGISPPSNSEHVNFYINVVTDDDHGSDVDGGHNSYNGYQLLQRSSYW